DAAGRFLSAELLEHNEPIFVSGLGQAPFHAFMRQYRGHSIFDSMTVGVPYGQGEDGGAHIYLDGVTKATASVRIAHESILAASLDVARTHMQGLAAGPAPRPLDTGPALTWQDLFDRGLAHRVTILNRDVEAAFQGTTWEDDDPEAAADPDGIFLEMVVVDIGPRRIAEAVLDVDTMAERDHLMTIADHDEPILFLANGRTGLVSEEFVRNTAPDRLFARQDGLPVALRDADIDVWTALGVPDFEHRMVLRTDRRLGFDPTRDWELLIRTVRAHGMFRPEVGTHDFAATLATPEEFFKRPETRVERPVWVESLLARRADLAVAVVGLMVLVLILARALRRFSSIGPFRPVRLGFLAAMVVFVGWWGQGQLSIVTVIGVIRTALDGASFAFLLYDPFSLLIWGIVLGSLIVWGRGFFCGWLCPYGALQELMHAAGRALRLPEWRVPERWDRPLKRVKYAVLAVLVLTALVMPAWNDALAEVEPFKTAITTGFDREIWFVLYAGFWLVLGLFVFKAFCRYLCPLGAFLALGGLARRWDWLPRRSECGSPCQLCTVKCQYGAIKRDGRVAYDECFQCLDCVTIHEDPKTCVPLILAAKRAARASA
ncbi:MAG: 4Fe-4S binding protein, partial [Pseudomonadota bacterium]